MTSPSGWWCRGEPTRVTSCTLNHGDRNGAKTDEEAAAGVGTAGNNEGRREHGVGNEVPPPVVAAAKPQTRQRKPQDKSFSGAAGIKEYHVRKSPITDRVTRELWRGEKPCARPHGSRLPPALIGVFPLVQASHGRALGAHL